MEESDVYVREEGDRPMEHSPRGRYIRFDIRLGTGAYKSVYKAYDTDQGIDVAWNAIDIGLLPSTEKTRIIQEVQLLQKLEHKNIINFYGSWFSKEKNQVVFITEIMTSGTLKSYIKRVQFIKWKIIKRWCIQILEGLHYLHSQNPPVIHRDLKCDNIFVNGNTGDLRIGDLGLSTQLAVDKRSKAQSVLGTPEFMAPELYDESYDEKVDVYAFGMCVLEMVTKEVPYSECINPAQIYKKVTAGIRPKGLQRVVSQAARDFIELCLSRGNGLVDVTAQYLLDHPFLKAQDDDNDMVECLDEDELERENKEEQQRLEKVAEESFAVEFNMESGSKGGAAVVISERRKQFPSLSLEPEEMSAASSASGSASAPGSGGSVIAAAPAEEKTAGTHRLIQVPPAGAPARDSITQPPSPVTDPVPTEAVAPAPAPVQTSTPPPEPAPTLTHSPSQPVISEMVAADEPLSSGKKNADAHVDRFLATLPGSESAIQNTRINIMGGRGQRLDLENDTTPEYAESPAESPVANGKETPEHSQSFTGEPSALPAHVAKVEPPNSAPGLLTPSQAPQAQVPAMQLPEPVVEPQTNLVRRASIHAPSDAAVAAAVAAAASEAVAPVPSQPSPPQPPPQVPQPTAPPPASNNAGATARKRVKRHDIKAAKDPDNEHSILLNLRIMIDGKSKEIKFPFNLFADSPHEVACELAVDVGILEPDLEDIADSIRFLVTEGKINNLSDVQEDVWEEAPEPHSFSSKPFPNVSKMSFVHVPHGAYQQQAFMMGAAGLERTQSASSVSTSGMPASVLQSVLGTSGTTVSAPAAVPPELVIPGSQEAPNTANLNDPSSTLMVLDGSIPLNSSSSSSTTSLPSFPSNDVVRSPPRPGLPHTASESTLTKEAWLNLLEMRARGASMGSITDPTYVQQMHQLEDRLKMARSSFNEQESSLEAAIRSEEEKHQREVERFRKKMEEFDKQRAAIARQQNGESAVFSDANGSSTALDENLRLLAQGETIPNANMQNPSAMLVEFDNDVGLPVDGSDEEPSPPPSGATSTTTVARLGNASTEAAARPLSVPVDELIPESYLQSAALSTAATDTATTTATAPTPSQPKPGQA
ncbi:WNK protein kinase [Phytophthora nicotianae INRA-310]|uniref:WNK protein kinase n=2 Tax=Phytophthora nicotianae TaxID=4792 RepID=W2R8T0_PHYN3|nr:WNK protein kinase [Phytophthora nicotianae INRA-310]ETN20935.1 WNK protein kinase [Phytophthora nicotianae INRA-310]KUF82335.1 Serine/threonine protein kinase [Phytophthora nicotianae]